MEKRKATKRIKLSGVQKTEERKKGSSRLAHTFISTSRPTILFDLTKRNNDVIFTMNLRTIANTSDEFTNKSSYSCRFWTKDSLFQNVRPLFLFFLSLLILPPTFFFFLPPFFNYWTAFCIKNIYYLVTKIVRYNWIGLFNLKYICQSEEWFVYLVLLLFVSFFLFFLSCLK